MLSFIKLATAAAALVGMVSATTYGQFCDDGNCSVNCGESVSVDNPGCLNESGRLSILFHDPNAQSVDLVYSPDPDCPCANYCEPNIVTEISAGYCYGMKGPPAQSYRFVGSASGCQTTGLC